MSDPEFDRIVKVLMEEAPGLFASITTIIAGIYIIYHDYRDFGKYEHEGREYRSFLDVFIDAIHHWQWGFIIFILGLVSLIANIIKIAIRLGIISIPSSVVDKLRGDYIWQSMRSILTRKLSSSQELDGLL